MVIAEMEREMQTLMESAGLFEVNVPDYKQLKQCRKEIVLLKTLWDYCGIVNSSITEWKTTPWLEINVEQMDMDCKKFAKVKLRIPFCNNNFLWEILH
jgi:dynein heavy chain